MCCPKCGPALRYRDGDGGVTDGDGALLRARQLLRDGGILAVKGIGGYHLACDANDDQAVAELRRRKRRGDKPFAVMVPDPPTACAIADVDDPSARLLAGPQRPIVLVPRRRDARIADAVAPRNPDLGVMLAYTPLHTLLFGLPGDATGPPVLVMTSGNLGGEPICFTDDDALERLSHLADGWLMHDRDILVPCDDSVVRVVTVGGADSQNTVGGADSQNTVGGADSQNTVGGADSQNTVGGADSQNTVGGADSQNTVGGADSQNTVGGADSQNTVGGADSQNTVGGADSQNTVGGADSQNTVGGADSQNTVGGADSQNTVGGADSQNEALELPIRRSRGYAPMPIALPVSVPPTMAVGADLKNTMAVADGKYAWLSQHIGDMDDLATLSAFDAAQRHLRELTAVEPEVLVADAHPLYRSTAWAHRNAAGRPVRTVQHHHAHIAAVMAEHGLDGSQQVLGFAFDGTGYGSDAAVWGGEVLLANYKGYQRLAQLKYVPLAGGDISVLRPYRMALAHLWAAGIAWEPDLPPVAACPADEQRALRHQLVTGLGCVPTSSMGRLFDAVSALTGVRQVVAYEAQAAIELEGLARGVDRGATSYLFDVDRWGQTALIDPAPVLQAVVRDQRGGVPAAVIGARFHCAVAEIWSSTSHVTGVMHRRPSRSLAASSRTPSCSN